jgi:alkylation response protein AidB-like acyl-CoA dehydrogenase
MLAAEPHDAVATVFTELGRAGSTATVLDDVVLDALGVAPGTGLAAVLPRFGTWLPPGRIDVERCRALGLATGRAATAEAFVLVCRSGPADTVVTIPRAAVDVRAIEGVDPAGGWHEVRVTDGVPTDPRLDPGRGADALAAGRRAVGHQTLGACRTMLDLARTHAQDRVQFGRPIARFQAVRHRLADALVAVETLDAVLGAAIDEPNDLTAALAKATAGRTARVVATSCQQVLAGIGFTTDHPFHRYLKRTMVLGGLFGTAEDIALDLGRHLLATRRVPTLIEL